MDATDVATEALQADVAAQLEEQSDGGSLVGETPNEPIGDRRNG
jgi:hypothetical protein